MLPASRLRARRHRPEGLVPSGPVTIPFDYGAILGITGEPGSMRQDVIAISGDGAFVAVAIGYGFEEERRRPILAATGAPIIINGPITSTGAPPLSDIGVDSWLDGVKLDLRFNPVADAASAGLGGATPLSLAGSLNRTPFQRVAARSDLSFLLSVVDTATGRELQDEPTHNLAALGASDGRRPFRALARPITFAPRTTLRIEVIERTADVRGTLFIVLVGYKVLDQPGCAPQRAASAAAAVPGSRVVPFDYVAAADLAGVPGRVVDVEVPIVSEAGAAVTAIGYGLDAVMEGVPLGPVGIATTSTGAVNLRQTTMAALGMQALLDGVRLRPSLLSVSVESDGGLATSLTRALADRVFERIATPGDVSFRYFLSDVATGRELQNRPLHNIGGLGSADGRRPFKHLARPLELEPRSVLRVTIEERVGRGRLYIVFQGFKVIASGGGRA
jgi:hypothetical protein